MSGRERAWREKVGNWLVEVKGKDAREAKRRDTEFAEV